MTIEPGFFRGSCPRCEWESDIPRPDSLKALRDAEQHEREAHMTIVDDEPQSPFAAAVASMEDDPA